MKKWKILLCDDHQLVLEGLDHLLNSHPNFQVVGMAKDGRELFKILSLIEIDVLLLDIDLPDKNGLDLLKRIKQDKPQLKVIMLTMHAEYGLVKQSIKLGANGYILKNASQKELEEGILKVLAGNVWISPEMEASKNPDRQPVQDINEETGNPIQMRSTLTEREIEVLRFIAKGYSNKEIGKELFLSHRTVDTHRTNLMRKLHIHNAAGLVRIAFQMGLV